MKELLKLADRFETSRPIFRLTMNSRRDSIDANIDCPVERYRPNALEGNILDDVLVDNYNESFNKTTGVFEINKHEIAGCAMSFIRNNIGLFIDRNLEMKNPRQSKLYKWVYRGMPNTPEFNDIIIMLYKYLRSFANNDMRSEDIPNIKNALALITAMEEKYSE